MEKVISERDDLVGNALFYFMSVNRFKYRGDVFSFGVPVSAQAGEFCSNWRRHIVVVESSRIVSYSSLI